MAQRVSPLYRKAIQVDSHIDKVIASLGLVALAKRPTREELLRRRLVSAFVIVLLVGYSLNPLFVQANTVIFYPSACLGGWQGAIQASGKPDAEGHFNESNSAVLGKNVHAEIYCGSFSGEEVDGALPTAAEITLHWSTLRSSAIPEADTHIEITGESFASSTVDILDTNSSSTVSFSTATTTEPEDALNEDQTEEAPPETSEEPPVSTPTPTTDTNAGAAEPEQATENTPPESEASQTVEENTPTTEVAPPQVQTESAAPSEVEPISVSSFFEFIVSLIIPSAYAQEATSSPQNTEVTEAPTDEAIEISVVATQNEETPIVLLEEVAEDVEETQPSGTEVETATSSGNDLATATTTAVETATSTPSAQSEEVNGEFLLVSYTVDGTTWKELVKVSSSQVSEASYALEIEGLTWQKLASVQVRVETLSTIDDTSEVFLDAMELRIDYTEKKSQKEDILSDSLLSPVAEGITSIKGVTGEIVFLKEKTGDKETFSLYNLTDKSKQEITIQQEISDTFPVGFKGGRMFLLTKDLKTLLVYDLGKKEFTEVFVPQFDISSGERATVSIEGFPWTILIGGENFYFRSEESGEVFSDEDSGFVNAVETNAVTDSLVNKQKLEELNFLKKEEPADVPADE